MTPGQWLEHIRSDIDSMVDECPLAPSGKMAYSDVMGDLDKMEHDYNRVKLNKENAND